MTDLRTQLYDSDELLATDQIFDEVHRIKTLNNPMVAQLAQATTAPDEARHILSQLTGQVVDDSVTLSTPFQTDFGCHISVGKDVFINKEAFFIDLGGITLEDNVLIGPRVTLITVNHIMDPAKRRGLTLAPVHIKRNAWLGANVTVLPGVTIGENAVIAAGSVVTKDVPNNVIVAGVPARVMNPVQG